MTVGWRATQMGCERENIRVLQSYYKYRRYFHRFSVCCCPSPYDRVSSHVMSSVFICSVHLCAPKFRISSKFAPRGRRRFESCMHRNIYRLPHGKYRLNCQFHGYLVKSHYYKSISLHLSRSRSRGSTVIKLCSLWLSVHLIQSVHLLQRPYYQ